MLYRKVPKTGDELSVLGFGAMRLPEKRGFIDEKRAAAQIRSAIDQGVNYIDTAATYHMGRSESLLGKILSVNGHRRQVRLATKLPHWSTRTKEAMDAALDKQLRKLRTDCVDYYLIHALNGHTWERAQKRGVLEFMEGALAAGKIRYAGFSFHGLVEDFKRIVDDYDWTFCQIQYNYLDTENQAGTAGMKYAAARDLAVMVMEPLRGGNLGRRPPAAVQALWDASETRRSPAEWALRWVLNHPEVTLALSGMNREAHIRENLRIASEAYAGSLADRETELVARAADTYRSLMKIGCTGCQYCMPCPYGVNIPYCFETYNAYHVFGDRGAKFMYLAFNCGAMGSSPSFASRCEKCGKCVAKCPQGLPIPDLLQDVAAEMEGRTTRPLSWLIKKLVRVKN